ncbi:uncharacterized protein LOC134245633 isoform X3 [Saccostrea cucullata]|uniref:uncharacterized protein LOC134245633 isoform X3 n=1 Tax=Saccostrea cuccullata TaxID=36930 RepID=UPI002ED4DA33
MRIIVILLNVTLFSQFAVACWHDNECSPWCKHEQHPKCFYGFCQCHVCLIDSHCSCKADEVPKCLPDHLFHYHYCKCQAQSSNTIASTTTSTTTTSTTKTTLPTTPLPLVPLECKHHKVSVIESIAENIHVEDNRAALCPSNNKHQSSEAYVINKCNATERFSWMQGLSLKTWCKTVERYTPISTFLENSNDVAGFFIGCSDSLDVLQIAAQTCSEPPMIFTLDETTTPRMSDFYTIQQWKPS